MELNEDGCHDDPCVKVFMLTLITCLCFFTHRLGVRAPVGCGRPRSGLHLHLVVGELDAVGVDGHDDADGNEDGHRDSFSDSVKKPDVDC